MKVQLMPRTESLHFQHELQNENPATGQHQKNETHVTLDIIS